MDYGVVDVDEWGVEARFFRFWHSTNPTLSNITYQGRLTMWRSTPQHNSSQVSRQPGANSTESASVEMMVQAVTAGTVLKLRVG